MPKLTRPQICQSAGRRLSAAAASAASLKNIGALVGFDGFVDEIIAVVDKRHDNQRFDPVKTIGHLGRKISNAAGESSNYELVVKQMKLGGNGPIMANALAALGLGVTYVGNLGYPTLHPVFAELARRAKVISIAEAGHTDALEFDDGKLMLGKLTPLNDINWETLVNRIGRENLGKLIADSRLVGMVNWTMLPHMSRIWATMLEEVMPRLQRRDRLFFIDLADPEKRTHADILEALQLLSRFQEHVDVMLGMNLKESMAVAEVLGLERQKDAEAAIEATAAAIRAKLNLQCVVIHPRRAAAAATAEQSARFEGPFVAQPKISTGAGDHFNAGFCLGRILGLGLEESLCVGVATSGYYVRSAQSPSAAQLAEFVLRLPSPEPSDAA